MISASATISEDGLYRTLLGRQWDEGTGQAVWGMLNPSTADGLINDPTINRTISFSRRWGFQGLAVVNIFALRATDPSELYTTSRDIFGPENGAAIRVALSSLAEGGGKLICAWGAHPLARMYSKIITHPAFELEVPLYCVGTTKDGSPRHPLYVHGDATPQLWTPYREAA